MQVGFFKKGEKLMSEKMVLMPIETQSRELDSRLALAHKLVGQGISVLIADQQYIRANAAKFKNGIYFGKHLFGKPRFQDTNLYNQLKKNNCSILYLSEEGGIYAGDEKAWISVLDRIEKPDLFDEDDIYCTWGRWQLDHAHKTYDLKCQTEITGAPRFSILSDKYNFIYEEAGKAKREKFGDYILINTSFSVYNGIGHEKSWFDNLPKWGGEKNDVLSFGMKKYAQQAYTVISMVELIYQLSIDLPQVNFVIRPHPSEDHNYYRNIFDKQENVHVIYEGSAIDWMYGARLLIQSGCTTGLEAAMMGKAVINWAPDFIKNEATIKIAQETGHTASTVEEVRDIISLNQMPDDATRLPQKDSETRLLENLNGIDSVEVLVDLIKQKLESKVAQNSWKPKKLHSIKHRLFLRLKEFFYYVSGRAYQMGDHNKRFGQFDRAEIDHKIDLFNEKFEKDVKIDYADRFCVVLKSD